MSEEKQDTEQTINLSDDDLKVALRLLSDEERLSETERSALKTLFLLVVVMIILVFACPVGLLTVWFEPALGIGLLIASVVAVIVVVAVSVVRRNPFEAITIVRQSVEDRRSGQAIATRVKPSQVSTASALLGCGGGLVMLLFFPGVGWFLCDLVTTRTVNLFSLILIAVPIAVLFLLGYYQMQQDYVHYSRVSRLHGLLKSQAQGTEKKALSSEEIAFLAQLESKQIAREVRQTAPEVRKQLAASYAIRTAPEARDYIRNLSVERSEAALDIRQAIDALESNPHPPEAQRVPGSADLLAIRRESSEIFYLVNDDARNISIVDIRGLDGEVKDAS